MFTSIFIGSSHHHHSIRTFELRPLASLVHFSSFDLLHPSASCTLALPIALFLSGFVEPPHCTICTQLHAHMTTLIDDIPSTPECRKPVPPSAQYSYRNGWASMILSLGSVNGSNDRREEWARLLDLIIQYPTYRSNISKYGTPPRVVPIQSLHMNTKLRSPSRDWWHLGARSVSPSDRRRCPLLSL